LLGVAVAGGAGSVCRAGDDCPCPTPYCHKMERPPCIKFKCMCPRPVCPPYCSEFFGYYPTCWRQWPAGWSNCPERCPPWVPGPTPPPDRTGGPPMMPGPPPGAPMTLPHSGGPMVPEEAGPGEALPMPQPGVSEQGPTLQQTAGWNAAYQEAGSYELMETVSVAGRPQLRPGRPVVPTLYLLVLPPGKDSP